MPQLRNITVHVTDGNGNDLEEWGVQNLRGNKVSAYIKSTTNMPFRVSIRPKIPYMDVQQLLPGSHHSQRIKGMDGGYIKMEESDEDVMNKIPSHPQARPQGKGPYLGFLAECYSTRRADR